MLRSLLFACTIAMPAVLFEASTVLAANDTKYVVLGQEIANGWHIIGCHPKTRELTVAAHAYTYNAHSFHTAPVRLVKGDSIAIDDNDADPSTAKLIEVNGCMGRFWIH